MGRIHILALCSSLLFCHLPAAYAQLAEPASALITARVWPEGRMPGSSAAEPETAQPAKGGMLNIVNVSHPTLAVYPAPGGGAAPAMIICPGGGYNLLAMNGEGTEIAAWLNTNGFTAMVLKYRVPRNREGALQDLQRALCLARTHAADWHLDPKRLGVIGFSAGGNLAAKASENFDKRNYSPLDDADTSSCRPDFAVLVYPAYLEKDGRLADDLSVQPGTSPTLIVHSEDDLRFVAGSKLYDAALTEAKVPHGFLLYTTGGHGYGLRCTKEARAWPTEALLWLHRLGITTPCKTI